MISDAHPFRTNRSRSSIHFRKLPSSRFCVNIGTPCSVLSDHAECSNRNITKNWSGDFTSLVASLPPVLNHINLLGRTTFYRPGSGGAGVDRYSPPHQVDCIYIPMGICRCSIDRYRRTSMLRHSIIKYPTILSLIGLFLLHSSCFERNLSLLTGG